MNLKSSQFSIQEKFAKDPDNCKEYPTLADLMKEQKVSNDAAKSVHHRRDLDALD